jgi:cysteine synthase
VVFLIDLSIRKEILDKNISLAREKGVAIPTFKHMKNPGSAPASLKERLKGAGLWDIDPLNLYRITWKNEPVESGGVFGAPNVLELPKSITGVDAHVAMLVGKWFPTGCHKVGAAFGCLAPRLVTGQFDASRQKAVWPSTGNYCRGGAFNSALLGVHSIAVLPRGMSRERFSWLEHVASEIIATPGTESNVKEIFDKVRELRSTRDDCVIFNQFEEMGNHLWHYEATGSAVVEAFNNIKTEGGRLAACCFTSGSAGTIGCGDYVKEIFPSVKIAVGEALQCPTITNNGFGEHGIEGIGDKHIPWIHNVKNTDLAAAIDDKDCLAILRLFNTKEGKRYLAEEAKVPQEIIGSLSLLGISGIANAICAIKTAKRYELGPDDYIFSVLTDSASMYASRVAEMDERLGPYTLLGAARDYGQHLMGIRDDWTEELTYWSRKRIHNLKYYTWVEQQGKSSEELDALWSESSWAAVHKQAREIDALIEDFNDKASR